MRKAVTGRKVGLLIRAPTCESRRNTQHEMNSRDPRLDWQDWRRFNSASEKRAMLCHCCRLTYKCPTLLIEDHKCEETLLRWKETLRPIEALDLLPDRWNLWRVFPMNLFPSGWDRLRREIDTQRKITKSWGRLIRREDMCLFDVGYPKFDEGNSPLLCIEFIMSR